MAVLVARTKTALLIPRAWFPVVRPLASVKTAVTTEVKVVAAESAARLKTVGAASAAPVELSKSILSELIRRSLMRSGAETVD